ncbi:D-glycero-beta-D-manno-heptose-7-phosphate kinase [Verticiella sediminum]|nr:D-glycero-beta-D-manno-heptose-7-phosphate kinase [Verticiella sediminum]
MKAPDSVFPAEAIARSRILVVGDVMIDRYWFGDVHRISPEAPVPVVHVSRSEDRLGGAANVARNIAALGAQVTLAGLVGRDETAGVVARLAEAEGIAHALVAADAPTTVKMRVLGRQQQLLRVDFEAMPDAAAVAGLTARVLPLIAGHDVVVLSDYAKGALGQVQALIAAAREAGKLALVDPKGDDYDRYRGASLVSPNRSEMLDAVGRWRDEGDLLGRAQALRSRLDIEALLVTRSEQGMTLFTDAGRDHVDAQAHEVFDVSGAGDTVLATLAVCRAAGLDWHAAMQWANRAAGIVVGKLGTSIITPEELQP